MRRFRTILLGGLLLALVIVIGVGVYLYIQANEDPVELGRVNDDIVFLSDRAGNWDIWVLSKDGELRNLTAEGDADDFFFNITFEGDVINFFTTRDGEITPATVEYDGDNLQTFNFITAGAFAITNELFDMDAAWSPDNQLVVYTSMRDYLTAFTDVPDLYIWDIEADTYRRLTDAPGSDQQPAWSPDGQRIAYAADSGSSENQDIYVLDLESGERALLSDDSGYDLQPAWSLDGDQLLYVSEQEDNQLMQGDLLSLLWVVDPDGENRRPFDPKNDVFKGDSTYSPDGQQVIYMSNEDGFWHLYVMDADGDNVRRLTEGEHNNIFPAWRPLPADQVLEAAPASSEE